MCKRKILIFIFLTLFIGTASFAQQEKRTLSLSLEDCILKAMENNLGVAIEVLNPELADISVALAQEKFLPSLSFSFSRRSTIQASYSWIDAAEQVATDRDDYSAQINQLIPTGGNFSISLTNYINDTNRKFNTINPVYSSTLRFNFTQPLLKNFGFKVNRREIIIARNNLDISENQLKRVLQQTVYNVEEAYWNLVYNIEILKVRQQSLKLAQDLLDKNKRAVEVGTLAPIEIFSAQSAVATREADILQAEALLKNSEDLLKTIINLAAEEGADLAKIIPTEKPSYEKREVSLDEALLMAMENRPDLEATRIDLKTREINLGYSKNQLLPGLNLTASYWSPGIGGDQILYLNDNPLTGVIVGTTPGGISDALKDVFDFKYNNWSVGITLDIPLNTFISRADYAQARANLELAKLRLKDQEQQIFLEIKNAVRAVQTDYKRVQAYKVARKLAEKTLEAEEEKLKVGITTPFFVLQYQRDLSTAQTNELKAIIDYNLSLARLNRALGISLKKKNIRFSEILGR